MVLCSVIKAGWRRETGNFWAMAFHFLSHHYMWMSTSFLQMPVHRKWWINSLFCVACICVFCFTYWAVYIRIHEFCHIYSANSLPHHTGMKCLEWASDRVVFSCWIGLNNYIIWTQHVLSVSLWFAIFLYPHLSFAVIYEDGQVFGLGALVPRLILLLAFKVVCLSIRRFLMWIWGQMWSLSAFW